MYCLSRLMLAPLVLALIGNVGQPPKQDVSHGLPAEQLFARSVVTKGDEYVNVRNTIIRQRLASIPVLRKKMSSRNWKERLLAQAMLDRMMEPDRYIRYEKLLDSVVKKAIGKPSSRVRSRPFRGVKYIAGGHGELGLIALKSRELGLIRPRSNEFEALESAEATAFIVELACTHPDAVVRCYAAVRLCYIETPHASEAVIDVLRNDDSPDVRIAILQNIGENTSQSVFVDVLGQDESHRVKTAVVKRITDPAAVPLLRAVLRFQGRLYELDSLHFAAIEALGKFEDHQSMAYLCHILQNSPRSKLRQASARALGRIGDPNALTVLTHTLENDRETRGQAAGAIAKIDFDALLPYLESKDRSTRGAAVNALGFATDKRAETYLIAALDDSERSIVKTAMYGLGRQGGPQASELIINILKQDERIMIREAAVFVLVMFLADEAETFQSALVEALQDDSDYVRCRAARALGKTGDSTALPALEKATIGADHTVRLAARSAIKKIKRRTQEKNGRDRIK